MKGMHGLLERKEGLHFSDLENKLRSEIAKSTDFAGASKQEQHEGRNLQFLTYSLILILVISIRTLMSLIGTENEVIPFVPVTPGSRRLRGNHNKHH